MSSFRKLVSDSESLPTVRVGRKPAGWPVAPARGQCCRSGPGGPNAKGGADGKPDRFWRSFLSGDRHGDSDRTVTVRRLDAAAAEACVASIGYAARAAG